MSSETTKVRAILAPYCIGTGFDIGFGGDPIVPDAITVDLARPYTRVGAARQILRLDARDLSPICDGCADFVYSSHLLEDFAWPDIHRAVAEWRRILRPGGLLVVCCPDERRYRAHCAARGEAPNEHHSIADFSLLSFRVFLSVFCPAEWVEVFTSDATEETYSWCLVARKTTAPGSNKKGER